MRPNAKCFPAWRQVGSFEGSSATWFTEHLLVHPASRMPCLDAWGSRFYAGGGDTYAMQQRPAGVDLVTADGGRLLAGMLESLREQPNHGGSGGGEGDGEGDGGSSDIGHDSSRNAGSKSSGGIGGQDEGGEGGGAVLVPRARRRFVADLRRTPKGGQVVGAKCRADLATSLAGLLSHLPTPPPPPSETPPVDGREALVAAGQGSSNSSSSNSNIGMSSSRISSIRSISSISSISSTSSSSSSSSNN
jgi:hypothetical protein